MSKSGFSTLNRWLGKKNKDKASGPNGKLSKSSTNLCISSTNLNDPSQLENNRITPLPAITSNAPFEQTFRITVLLPKDQLYVARLGARVSLSKLLELVCDHKSLDTQKYEFRNPVDPSQIYNCDLTIGSVGLSEIRLCHKSDSYDSYNSDEAIKLHRTSHIRDSLSSSEFSSRNSKHTTKTASPYSSSNSLNSMDSTGINYTRTSISAPPALPKSTPPQKVTAPPRKKRTAPRPPSQNVLPENNALVIEQAKASKTEQTIVALKQNQDITPDVTMRKDYYASTPNLVTGDFNGNASPNLIPKTETITNGNFEDESMNVAQKNARNLPSLSVKNFSKETVLPSSGEEVTKNLPEPSPRKRLIQTKKKSAPAPPPRCISMNNGDDVISIAFTTPSTPVTPNMAGWENNITFSEEPIRNVEHDNQAPSSGSRIQFETPAKQPLQSSTPVPLTNSTESKLETLNLEFFPPKNLPKPSPRQTTTTLLNASSPPASPPHAVTQRGNVSKVLLNRSPTPEPRTLSCEPNETGGHLSNITCDDDNESKQADSGIGEPVPSPLPDSLPSESFAHDCKLSTFESSSDDDETIKTYNFKLGKTTVKTLLEERRQTTLNELRSMSPDSGEVTPNALKQGPTLNSAEAASWNSIVPISPPPTFADNANSAFTDAPITPKILERPVLNFDSLTTAQSTAQPTATPTENSSDVADHSNLKAKIPFEKCTPRTPLPSPSTSINEIIDELSTLLSENRVDMLIKKHDEQIKIESVKPINLPNFSITALTSQQKTSRPVEKSSSIELTSQERDQLATPSSPVTEEKHHTRGSITNNSSLVKQRLKSVCRADSFHTSRRKSAESTTGLNFRSASYLSLTKLEQNCSLSQRRSSSELSIGESPSLQSLELIKTVLNSRKNSLANSSDNETNKSPAKTVDKIITSVQFKPHQLESIVRQTTSEITVKSIDTPKIYHYSGPPSINFSTWSERPKVPVAIKNEGDYIFGGKNAGARNAVVTHADVEMRSAATVPRTQRATLPASGFKGFTPTAVVPKYTEATTTERMGIAEKEYHVPLTVRPLMDVIIDNATKSEVDSKEQAPIEKRTCHELISNSTLPRYSNRFSMPPKTIVTGPSLLRSTSITKLETEQRSPSSTKTENESEANVLAPFGQNTLRRTGLKEKILAKEELAQKQQQITPNQNSIKIPKSHVNTNTVTPLAKTNRATCTSVGTQISGSQNAYKMPLQNSSKIRQKSKLELKLSSKFGQQDVVKTPESPTPKSAPPALPPAAPPVPVLKIVALRSQSSATVATSPAKADTRNALLEAIRNFRRDGLNKV